MIEIHIVDDHHLLVELLSRMINTSNRMKVTGKYFDLNSCRQGLAKKQPDVLLLDVELPDGNGVDFCGEITMIYPHLKIIILTSYKEFNTVKHALYNGALGYVLKNAAPEEILAGIETVNRGQQFLCEKVNHLLEDKKDAKAIWLTNREKEILKYTAEGYTAKQTADLICRDPETVKTCRKNLFIKLNAKNVAELIKKCYEMKIIW